MKFLLFEFAFGRARIKALYPPPQYIGSIPPNFQVSISELLSSFKLVNTLLLLLLQLANMALNILQLATEFTQDSIATVASPCERPSCSVIIQPGENRFYYGAAGRSDLPGRFFCQSCNKHYLDKRSTTARVVPTARIPSE